jgi:hypothetical protein
LRKIVEKLNVEGRMALEELLDLLMPAESGFAQGGFA